MVKIVCITHMVRRLLITTVFILVLGSSFREPLSIFNITKGNITFSSDAPLELITAASNELKGLIETEKKTICFFD